MPRLARLRFVSIGHPQARMDDLTLDFRDAAGEPTDSTLWLRNGGGKSSILNLFFALPRPHKAEFLGGRAEAKQRSIEDYILSGDRAVMVAEWSLDPPPDTFGLEEDRFLTGTFHERREGSGDLRRLFFSTRVDPRHPSSTLEGLPLYSANGSRSRRTLASFREAWRSLRDGAPHLNPSDTESQREWQETLEAARIDPELFSYQVRMNQREGGADELFRFSEAEDFIDFLLALALDPGLGNRVGRNIAAWRRELVERKERLLPEAELASGLRDRMRVIEEIRSRRQALRRRLGELGARVLELESQGTDRGRELSDEVSEAEAARLRHLAEEERLRAESAAQVLRGTGLRLHAATLRLHELESAYTHAQESWREADRVRRIWTGAYPLHRARQFESSARAYRLRLEEREAEHAPLRQELVAVAGRLARGLTWRAAEERRRADQARAAERDHRHDAAGYREQSREADVRHARLEVRLEELESRLAEVSRRRERLIGDALLGGDEGPEAGLDRWVAAERDLRAAIDRIDREVRGVDETLAALRGAIDHAAEAVQERQTESRLLAERWAEATRVRSEIESDPVLLAALELETLDADRLDPSAAITLEATARGEERRIVDTRLTMAEDERRRLHLDERGLLPPSPDAELVAEFLEARLGGQAWTGWTWIAANVPPAEAREAVRRAPSLAQGVVVRPDDLARAQELLEEAGIEPEGLIHLTGTDGLDGFPLLPGRMVGPGETAWFDRDAARARGLEIRARLEQEARRLAAAEERHRELVQAREQLRSFRERYPRGWFASTDRAMREAESQEHEARARLTELRDDQARHAAERHHLEAERRETEASRRDAGEATARVQSFVEEHHRPAASWRGELASVRDDASRTAEESRQWEEMARAAEARADTAASEIQGHAEDARSLEDERDRVAYVEGDVEPEPGPLDELRGQYRRLATHYEKEVGADGLVALAEENDAHAREERGRLRKLLSREVPEEVVAEHLDRLDDVERIEELRVDAEAEAGSLFGRMGNLKGRIDPAAEAVRRAEERCRALEVGIPDRAPSTPELADAEAATLEDKARSNDRAADSAHHEATAIAERMARVLRRAEDLTRHVKRLERLGSDYEDLLALAIELPEPPARGPLDESGLEPEIDRLTDALRSARSEGQDFDAERARATASIRSFVAAPDFQSLETPWLIRIQEHDEPALEEASERLAAQLEVRRNVLTEQIADVDRHRAVLVDELLAVADEGLKLLRQASTLSTLPDHLPGIGGAQFLRIATREPDEPEERRGRLALLVDELAEGKGDLGGVSLVQAAVRRLGRPFQVRVLHPDPALDRRTVSIPEMARASGGEQLTGAIMLYCTLARVRGRARGRSRKSSSVLLLDNPIGRASRVRFLELQREVARAMGVQLIYTTGVNDHEALRALPNILRLRNERVDRNTGRRLVEHEAIAQHVVEAVRVGRRESASQPTSDEPISDEPISHAPTSHAPTNHEPTSHAPTSHAPTSDEPT